MLLFLLLLLQECALVCVDTCNLECEHLRLLTFMMEVRVTSA